MEGRLCATTKTQVDLVRERECDVLARRTEPASKLEVEGTSFPTSFEENEELQATARTERGGLESERRPAGRPSNGPYRPAARQKRRSATSKRSSIPYDLPGCLRYPHLHMPRCFTSSGRAMQG